MYTQTHRLRLSSVVLLILLNIRREAGFWLLKCKQILKQKRDGQYKKYTAYKNYF